MLISYCTIPIRFDWNDKHSVTNKQFQVSFFLCRHDMPRKKKTTQSSETDCATGTSVASGHVLRPNSKQTTLPFAVMSTGKKTPMPTSMSTPSKARVQQLLTHISPEVLHSALRSFQQWTPTTTLLVTNQNSPVVVLSRISTPGQGTMKLSPALPSGIVSEGELGRKLPPPPSSPSPKEISEGSVTVTDSGFGPEPDKLSQESRAPSVSPVAKAGSHSA